MNERARAWLSGVILTGFFAVLAALMLLEVPVNAREALLIMLGALTASMTSVISYYFGSSSGSTAKDATISEALMSAPPPAPGPALEKNATPGPPETR